MYVYKRNYISFGYINVIVWFFTSCSFISGHQNVGGTSLTLKPDEGKSFLDHLKRASLADCGKTNSVS
jgi:hypothetical protein